MGRTLAADCVRMCAALSLLMLGAACGSGSISDEPEGGGASAATGGKSSQGSGGASGSSGSAGKGGSASAAGSAGSGSAGGGSAGSAGGGNAGGNQSGGSAGVGNTNPGGGAGLPGTGGGGGAPQTAASVPVHLVPNQGASGMLRVNFAVPLPSALLFDAAQARVISAGTELSSARRGPFDVCRRQLAQPASAARPERSRRKRPRGPDR